MTDVIQNQQLTLIHRNRGGELHVVDERGQWQ